MDQQTGFEITGNRIPLLREDGRLHFARQKALSVRVLEWLVPTLWLLAPAAVLAALL